MDAAAEERSRERGKERERGGERQRVGRCKLWHLKATSKPIEQNNFVLFPDRHLKGFHLD